MGQLPTLDPSDDNVAGIWFVYVCLCVSILPISHSIWEPIYASLVDQEHTLIGLSSACLLYNATTRRWCRVIVSLLLFNQTCCPFFLFDFTTYLKRLTLQHKYIFLVSTIVVHRTIMYLFLTLECVRLQVEEYTHVPCILLLLLLLLRPFLLFLEKVRAIVSIIRRWATSW